ncbi:hypothetical protein HN011_011405 [Eciton burchellii]|nr:hypothetical protein HN011_011405 [Eciton burchellii]
MRCAGSYCCKDSAPGTVVAQKRLGCSNTTRRALSLLNVPIYGWMDSTITLAWLKQHPSKWKTYVANRVSEVQTLSLDVTWQHVSSKENPIDCASRELSASMLSSHDLWWNGPPWLKSASTTWPKRDSTTPNHVWSGVP